MSKFLSLIFILGFFGAAAIANDCSCLPRPESKNYIGEARQKRFIGSYVNWTCDYQCLVKDASSAVIKNVIVRATYEQRIWGQENGLEGICEGMVYEPHENLDLLRTIYGFEGEIHAIQPARSSSANFKAWAQQNHCSL